jgi:FeS assembly SUF system regulator
MVIARGGGMLRISKLADYGTVVMVFLARNSQTLCNAKEIALDTHLGIPTVSKLLKLLTKANLLESTRGPAGGYSLKRSSHDISVAQIIFAVEQRAGLTECSIGNSQCQIQAVCGIKGNWRLINNAIESALDSVSLAALSKQELRQVDVEKIRRVASGD